MIKSPCWGRCSVLRRSLRWHRRRQGAPGVIKVGVVAVVAQRLIVVCAVTAEHLKPLRPPAWRASEFCHGPRIDGRLRAERVKVMSCGMCSLTHSLTHSLTRLLTRSLTHSLSLGTTQAGSRVEHERGRHDARRFKRKPNSRRGQCVLTQNLLLFKIEVHRPQDFRRRRTETPTSFSVVWDGRGQARSGHGTASGSAKKSPRWFRSRWQDCGGVQECLAV